MADRTPTGCRRCRTPLLGTTYLQLGVNLPPVEGVKSNKLCLNCLDRCMERDGHKTVRDFTIAYIRAHRPDSLATLKAENESLQAQINELRNMLSPK